MSSGGLWEAFRKFGSLCKALGEALGASRRGSRGVSGRPKLARLANKQSSQTR